MKLCKDCAFYTASDRPNDKAGEYARCAGRPTGPARISPVTGYQSVEQYNGTRFAFCEGARSEIGQCGPEARLFVARDKEAA